MSDLGNGDPKSGEMVVLASTLLRVVDIRDGCVFLVRDGDGREAWVPLAWLIRGSRQRHPHDGTRR